MVKVIINNIKKATIKTKDQPKKATIKTKSRSKRKKHLYNRETITDYEEHIGGGKISNLFNIFVNKQKQEEAKIKKKIRMWNRRGFYIFRKI